MLEIAVELGTRRYVVAVGSGLMDELPSRLAAVAGRRMLLVASRRVFRLHGERVQAALSQLGPLHVAELPDGERYKSPLTLAKLYDACIETRLGRDGLIVALGGGVVGDMAGFAAATYMRGVDWVGLPTTLLAMVDSSVGGKVGINHPKGKNLIGAFHQPKAVVIDPSFLATLPIRELRSGAYEVLKCALIGDAQLLELLRQAPAGLRGWSGPGLEQAIAGSCRLKADVVTKDEREGGLRRVLNLGHTIGHALETVTGYRRFTHGEAVGWGTIAAAAIARTRGLLANVDFHTIASAVDHVGPRPAVHDLPAASILEAIGRDKKAKAGRVPFVLPTAIGSVAILDDVSSDEITTVLAMLADQAPLPG